MVLSLGASTLVDHVGRVIGGSAEKEMIGIDAQGTIAAMTHERTVWNRPKDHHPHRPMRILLFAVSQDAIPISRLATDPEPTFIQHG